MLAVHDFSIYRCHLYTGFISAEVNKQLQKLCLQHCTASDDMCIYTYKYVPLTARDMSQSAGTYCQLYVATKFS